MNSSDRGFDSLAFKWRRQIEICEAIKGLTPREQIAYYRRQSEWFRKAREKPAPPG